MPYVKRNCLVATIVAVVLAVGMCPFAAGADEPGDLEATGLMTAQSSAAIGSWQLVDGALTVYSWTGSAVKPPVVVKDTDGKVLTEGVDYKLQYTDVNEKGRTYLDSVTAEGDYAVWAKPLGDRSAGTYNPGSSNQFSISKPEHDLSRATVTGPATYEYSGDSMEGLLLPTVTVSGKELTVGANNKATTTDCYLFYGKGGWDGSGTLGKHTVEIYSNKNSDGSKKYYGVAKYEYEVVEKGAASTPKMHRLYNPNSGEHFYTSDEAEYQNVKGAGWNDEGFGWTAPASSNTPVYRMYNKYGGEHHYTTDAKEKDALVKAGWNYEGIGWYSDDAKSVPLYREYNPNAFANNHNYTTNADEHKHLLSLGWRDEGYAWYGV